MVDSVGNIDIVGQFSSGLGGDNPPGYPQLMFTRSADQGQTFSTPVLILAGSSVNGVQSYLGPANVIVENSGAIDVAVETASGIGAMGPIQPSVVFARSADGNTWAVQTLAATGENPRLVQDSCNAINVIWDTSVTFNPGGDVFLSRSLDGVTFATPANISYNGDNAPTSPWSSKGGGIPMVAGIAADKSGNVYVTWTNADPAATLLAVQNGNVDTPSCR
jgi:hypothetical protein